MERITVARIGKTHGLKGYIKVNSFSGSYGHLIDIEEGILVFRHGKEIPVRIEAVVPFGDRALMKFVGYDTPESARTLTGGELWVDKKHAAPLGQDEYYIADLKGCSVIHGDEELGTVIGVAETGQADLLEVKTVDRGFRYLPLKDEYVGRVDTKGKRIELKAVWILE
ncbi:ribosome maturation factor RimM [Marispirochaeta sp.]|jgi:16S rRNA processing protein RimM|uniref:ribosome maturation factor RimM n=1 Tax=Marispirochaeta sp. TaxID=2038653 RepID=UPI0029C69019|nr:ribosome maturation factor RimM [Marispirochaeta sp.]